MFHFETKKQLAFDFKMETVLEEARAIIKGKISIKPYISTSRKESCLMSRM